jgi:integrase
MYLTTANEGFSKMVGGTWTPPKYTGIPKLPFVPKETEIDQLIAACTHRIGTFIQLLKETGVRCGEAWQLEWDHFDFETNTVRITPREEQQPTNISRKPPSLSACYSFYQETTVNTSSLNKKCHLTTSETTTTTKANALHKKSKIPV